MHAEETGTGLARCYAFGPYMLWPERQLLTREGAAVRIGGRALDLLTALVERPGELVDKHDLLAWVWPRAFVDEANLKAQMTILRRTLEDRCAEPRFIATVAGRGYRFVSPARALGAQRSI
jgi:DNA-binding winged helix-turn-helix (wHTH) protein